LYGCLRCLELVEGKELDENIFQREEKWKGRRGETPVQVTADPSKSVSEKMDYYFW
jgi:hypothetical protein